jgi:hypothetical protein
VPRLYPSHLAPLLSPRRGTSAHPLARPEMVIVRTADGWCRNGQGLAFVVLALLAEAAPCMAQTAPCGGGSYLCAQMPVPEETCKCGAGGVGNCKGACIWGAPCVCDCSCNPSYSCDKSGTGTCVRDDTVGTYSDQQTCQKSCALPPPTPPPTPLPPHPPTPPPTPNPTNACTGKSTNLPTDQCAAWIALYDGAGGPKWGSCSGFRTDPCACELGGKAHVCDTARTSVVQLYVRYSPHPRLAPAPHA